MLKAACLMFQFDPHTGKLGCGGPVFRELQLQTDCLTEVEVAEFLRILNMNRGRCIINMACSQPAILCESPIVLQVVYFRLGFRELTRKSKVLHMVPA